MALTELETLADKLNERKRDADQRCEMKQIAKAINERYLNKVDRDFFNSLLKLLLLLLICRDYFSHLLLTLGAFGMIPLALVLNWELMERASGGHHWDGELQSLWRLFLHRFVRSAHGPRTPRKV